MKSEKVHSFFFFANEKLRVERERALGVEGLPNFCPFQRSNEQLNALFMLRTRRIYYRYRSRLGRHIPYANYLKRLRREKRQIWDMSETWIFAADDRRLDWRQKRRNRKKKSLGCEHQTTDDQKVKGHTVDDTFRK